MKQIILFLTLLSIVSCNNSLSGLYYREGRISEGFIIKEIDNNHILITPVLLSNDQDPKEMADSIHVKLIKKKLNFEINFDSKIIVFEMILEEDRIYGKEYFKDNPNKSRMNSYKKSDNY